MFSTVSVTVAASSSDLTLLATLKTTLGISGSGSDTELSATIKQASGMIASYCRRPEGFGRETVVETFRSPCGAAKLVLQRDLVPAVSAVAEDGVTLAGTDWLLDGIMLRRLSSDVPSCWTASKIAVTYQGGYTLPASVPADLERACLDLCGTIWASKGRDRTIRSETVDAVGSVSYLDPDADSGGLPRAVADAVAAYRRLLV